jgi:hypothetical protein
MNTETIKRQGIDIIIPCGCDLIELDYTHRMKVSSLLIYYYPEQKKVVIMYECFGAYTGYNVNRYGKDGYTFAVIFFNA